ncbi:MAG: Permease of the major facilitator superfamily [Thermoleophilia bacterium]|nr:Permease of the major facilitator superfamily [Thermoleophilia bacterium]
MVKRIVGWIVLVPLCVALIVFALANRQLVVVNFNPFMPVDMLTAPGFGVPLFIVLFVALLTGVLLGGVATWFAQGSVRRDKRHWRREAERLSHDMEELRKRTGIPHARHELAEVEDFIDNP